MNILRTPRESRLQPCGLAHANVVSVACLHCRAACIFENCNPWARVS